ncbi:hypothetical protein R3P38DRAFT_357729 [Favolaschia claudopus]|uniref:Reverse transcriptase n=1 Tax=Favolaschia claudopus TaxID=2862362 RepID=A0AAV9ZIT5_9AGAR
MREKKNVPPEICWRQLRHRFTVSLKKELDAYRERVNNTKKRADRNKVLPIGVPNDMFEHPEDYGVLDFKIKVRKENIDRVREIWAPRDHEVFQLVPPSFAVIIARMYEEINKPEITRQNCWDVYLALLAKFHALDAIQGIPTNAGVVPSHWRVRTVRVILSSCTVQRKGHEIHDVVGHENPNIMSRNS